MQFTTVFALAQLYTFLVLTIAAWSLATTALFLDPQKAKIYACQLSAGVLVACCLLASWSLHVGIKKESHAIVWLSLALQVSHDISSSQFLERGTKGRNTSKFG